MKPFYSIDELCDLLGDNSDPLAISDALIAANVKMVYAGKEADLSGWYPSRPKTDANGTVRITVGYISNPHPHEVIVATESLPESWKKKLKHIEDALTHDADKPIGARERTTLLVIIGALAEHANLDLSQPHKAGDAVAAMLAAKGVTISGRTIGEHLKAVREAMDSRKMK
jgi:hypothetical protein